MLNPYSHLSDEELMKLYQKGENMAFELIYERNKGRIYSYLNKRLADDHIIDEVFQNILLKFHNSRLNYDSKYPLGKWLYTICKSELLDFKKKKSICFEKLEDEHLISDNSELSHNIELTDIKELSEKEKKAISLRYYSDQDFSEISSLLETSEANVRKLISRGLAKIRLKYLGVKSE